jgi:ribosomal protein S15P/S13E
VVSKREYDARDSKDPVVQAVMLLVDEVRELRKELAQERKDAAKRRDRAARSGR